MKKTLKLVGMLALVAAAAACGAKGDDAETPEAKEAKQIFTMRCSTCHGAQGYGDGPASGTLNPKPRRFNDKAWQASVTDEHIEKIIQYGGTAVGKSAAMPANPDLADKPLIIKALRQRVRRLGGIK